MSNSFNLNNLNNINNINLNMYPTTNTNTTLGNIMIMPTSLHNNIEINMNPTINLDAPKVVTPTDSSWVNDWK